MAFAGKNSSHSRHEASSRAAYVVEKLTLQSGGSPPGREERAVNSVKVGDVLI